MYTSESISKVLNIVVVQVQHKLKRKKRERKKDRTKESMKEKKKESITRARMSAARTNKKC